MALGLHRGRGGRLRTDVWLFAGTALLLLAAVVLAGAGAGVPVSLLVVALAPVVTIIGFESIGHRHMAEALRRL